jgi:hypothetical protein
VTYSAIRLYFCSVYLLNPGAGCCHRRSMAHRTLDVEFHPQMLGCLLRPWWAQSRSRCKTACAIAPESAIATSSFPLLCHHSLRMGWSGLHLCKPTGPALCLRSNLHSAAGSRHSASLAEYCLGCSGPKELPGHWKQTQSCKRLKTQRTLFPSRVLLLGVRRS